ncbi:hypothetical protein [Treponema denticola]|uniref:hypothetical protein n=1 Tax=Treponema denticola TaxID=158 RepID=UPI0021037FDA|nr:hypothetical protein [Treponema denticola]UTY23681.1 hypothetical protein E4N78_05725 [Treponema denticola]
MDIRILYVKDAGNKSAERIVLEANNDCDIGDYILFDTTYDGNYISNKLRHNYWFPDKKIKAGDKIILYSKQGIERSKKNISGNTSHFFYWDLDIAVWNKSKDCALLVNIEDYLVKKIDI